LLAATKSLTVFGTVHAPLIHPILAAKQFVTVDHIGRWRFGLNIVCGWNEDEFEMFGERQREHDTRYVFGQEWLDVVQRIWTCSDVFDLQPEGRDRRSQAAESGATRTPIPAQGGQQSGDCGQQVMAA
jgi:alkanesulfonate monooxygenase SsuD/methylene tetrahydromethanopterin reductase-like flavin-dependent oxidoreductase (luciferase family)